MLGVEVLPHSPTRFVGMRGGTVRRECTPFYAGDKPARTQHPSLWTRNVNPQGGVEGGKRPRLHPEGHWLAKKRHKSEIGCSGGSKSVGGSLWDLSISKDRCTGFSGQRRPPHGILGPFLGGVFRVHLRTAFPGCISRVATDLELTAERRAMCGSPFQRVSFST